jgi:hypothetical protein
VCSIVVGINHLYKKQVLWFDHLLLLRDFGPYVIMFMNVRVVYNCCHGMSIICC